MIDKGYYEFKELLKYNNIVHLITKKPYDINPITNNNLIDEYNKIKRELGVDYIIKKPTQNHTSNVCIVTKDNINNEFLNVDGLITDLKGVLLVTSIADCQSILLFDKEKNIIGNIHSGWKGTLNKIIENAIRLMIKEYNSNPKDIVACISPSIMDCCFEVDEDVVTMFKNSFSNMDKYIKKGNNSKYNIDTVSLNKDLLISLGLDEDNIIVSNICTKCNHEKFHSYRYDHDMSGRNASVIGICKE